MQDPRTRYKLHDAAIGKGHYGTTYLATSKDASEVLACKTVSKQRKDLSREEVRKEANMMWRLRGHPNIIKFYEVWEDYASYYIFMEACLGGELFDYIINKGQLEEHEAASIARTMLQVVRHCHAHGICHRDLKPENFLLKKRLGEGETMNYEDLRCIDFGLSKFLVPENLPMTEMVGSCYYVAPEVLKKNYGPEVDLWSIGVIIYILLSGMPPFWGQKTQDIFRRILVEPINTNAEPWADVSAQAKDLVLQLLHREPSKRLSAAQALEHRWMVEGVASTTNVLTGSVLARLKQFTKASRLRALLLNIVSRHLSPDAIAALKGVFAEIDTDGSGYLSFDELKTAFTRMGGSQLEQRQLRQIMGALDVTTDGGVDYQEFIAAAIDNQEHLSKELLSSIFKSIDTNGDGYITAEELRTALQECEISVDVATLEALIRQEGSPHREQSAAVSGEGIISFENFMSVLLDGSDATDEDVAQLEKVLEDLQHYHRSNEFRRLSRMVVARFVPADEVVSGLRKVFEALDTNKDGSISAEELYAGLLRTGYEPVREDVDRLVKMLDVKKTGNVDYEEFIAGALQEQQWITEAKMRVIFNHFDSNGDGYIDKAEAAHVLHEFNLPESHANNLLKMADRDNDHRVDYLEFKQMLTSSKVTSQLHSNSSSSLEGRSSLGRLINHLEVAWMGGDPNSAAVAMTPAAKRKKARSTLR